MTDFWRRTAVEAELRRGAMRRNGPYSLREVGYGRVADTAVFECAPCGGPGHAPGRSARLTVQVRTNVTIRWDGPESEGFPDTRDGQIAIGAQGGHPDQLYTWVQIVSAAPERLVGFDGSVRVEDVARESEVAAVFGSDLQWAGRTWRVDAGNGHSARYAEVGVSLRTAGFPNCETIYDRPSTQLGLSAWMRENPTVATVEKSSQFQSFLYQLPVLREERPYLPHTSPVAVVAWTRDEWLERSRPEAEISWRGDYRVHFIHPNPVVPAGMVTSLWRIFHGR